MNFLKSVFSESDGSGSASRVMIGMIVSFILGIGIAFSTLVCSHKITIEQFNDFLNKGGSFILTTCGPLYGINKAADAYKNNKGQ